MGARTVNQTKSEYKTVNINGSDKDPLYKLDFFDVLINRYLPILSITYISSVVGMALKKGGVVGFISIFTTESIIYWLGLGVAAWVSVPAIIWILMRGICSLESFANNWYKSTTFLMVSVLLGSFLLFPPDDQIQGFWFFLRLFIAAAIPIHIVQYIFFTRGGLPTEYSVGLSVAAISLAMYGLLVV